MRMENFAAGIYSEAAETAGGELRAADMANLRFDKNGFLTQRIDYSNIRDIFGGHADDSSIDGIAKVRDIEFYNVAGNLWWRSGNGNAAQITNVTDLEGRISVIDNYANYTILTSEGEDSGYLITIDDGVIAYPLSYPAPSFDPNFRVRTGNFGSVHPPYDKYNYYVFQYTAETYYPESHEDYVESNSRILGFTSKRSEVYEANLISDPGGHEESWRRMTVEFPEGNSFDVIRVGIFRSDSYDNAITNPQALDDSDFKFVGEVGRDDAVDGLLIFDDGVTQAGWENNPVLNPSTAFPSTATSIVEWRDIVFATCGDELRYNEVTAGAPVPAQWPAKNSYPPRGGNKVTFAVGYFDFLLFGDKRHTRRLYGNVRPFDAAEHTHNRGALNTYATQVLENGIAMITETGFYIADGSRMQKVSAPLDDFFKNNNAVDGCIVQFPNAQILWSVFHVSRKHKQFLMRRVGNVSAFEAWSDVEIKQAIQRDSSAIAIAVEGAEWEMDGVGWDFYDDTITHTEILCADGSDVVKLIDWNDPSNDGSVEWSWESHEIYGKQNTLAMTRKIYRNLYINGESDNDVKIIFETEKGSVERTKRLTLDKAQPARIPIRKYGQFIKFRLEGSGFVKLKGFYFEYEAVRSLQ